jgi:ankyrin repeat protein
VLFTNLLFHSSLGRPNSRKFHRPDLVRAVCRGDSVEGVRELLGAGTNPRETDETRHNALYYALRAGNVEVAKLLASALGNWSTGNLCDSDVDASPVHVLAAHGRAHALRELLLDGVVDVNGGHGSCRTPPLFLALLWGHDGTARVLLQHGADPSLRDISSNETAFDVARSRSRRDMVALLEVGFSWSSPMQT